MSTRPNPYAPADAEHPHRHWNQARVPGRKVQRRQKRARGEFRPRRLTRRFVAHPRSVEPALSILQRFVAKARVGGKQPAARKGGDR